MPPAALAHTTRSFTGLTAKNRWVVPLTWDVTVGPLLGELRKVAGVGSTLPEQAIASRAAAIESGRSIWLLLSF